MGTKHSPLPWHVEGEHIFDAILARVATLDLSDDDERTVTGQGETPPGTGRANGEMIVRAVNSHADLLEALRPFADLLESPDEWPDDTFECFVDVADIKRAVAAIAKAEGSAK